MTADDFAVAATIDGNSCYVIYDRTYLDQEEGTLSVQGATPVAYVRDADKGSVEIGDTVTVSGSSFTVRGVEPDGTGITLLVLQDA